MGSVTFRVSEANSILESSISNSEESCVHFFPFLSARFHEPQPMFLRKGPAFFIGDLSTIYKIRLVSHQRDTNPRLRVAVNLSQVLRQRQETLPIRNIVDDYDPVSAPVVTGGDGTKALLPCCVPLKQIGDRSRERQTYKMGW